MKEDSHWTYLETQAGREGALRTGFWRVASINLRHHSGVFNLR